MSRKSFRKSKGRKTRSMRKRTGGGEENFNNIVNIGIVARYLRRYPLGRHAANTDIESIKNETNPIIFENLTKIANKGQESCSFYRTGIGASELCEDNKARNYYKASVIAKKLGKTKLQIKLIEKGNKHKSSVKISAIDNLEKEIDKREADHNAAARTADNMIDSSLKANKQKYIPHIRQVLANLHIKNSTLFMNEHGEGTYRTINVFDTFKTKHKSQMETPISSDAWNALFPIKEELLLDDEDSALTVDQNVQMWMQELQFEYKKQSTGAISDLKVYYKGEEIRLITTDGGKRCRNKKSRKTRRR